MMPGSPRQRAGFRASASAGGVRWRRRRGRVATLLGVVVLVSAGAACGSAGGAGEVAAVEVSARELSAAVGAAGEVSVLLSSSGLERSCGLLPDGAVRCWGYDEGGEWALHPAGAFTAVSLGHKHVCGLRPDGDVWCWLWNDHGEADAPEGAFVAVTAGGVHTCGLRPDGTAECWGDGPEVLVQSPVADVVHPGGAFTALSAGYAHACGLRPDGDVDCWGRNWFGQTDAPAGRFVAVDAGASHSCGLRPDGSIVCWGRDSLGSAGRMSNRYRYGGTPSEVPANRGEPPELPVRGEALWGTVLERSATWEPPPGPYVAVSAGHGFTCGLRLDGTVACWGYLDDDSEPRIPLQVFEDVLGTEIMGEYTRARAELDATAPQDGTLADSLAHAAAELQNETMRAILELPRPPSGRFLAVDAGYRRACGLRPDGTIECWGANYSGAASPPPGPFAVTPVPTTVTTG